MTVQLLDVPVDVYHSDAVTDTPTLNASVAKALLLETPAHAREKHPRLAANYEAKHTDAMDEGTALHQILLGDDRVDVLPFDSFRTAEAKAARSDCRDAGRVPMLQHRWDEIAVLGNALKTQVAAFPIDPPLFVEGMAEQTIVWTEPNGVACRARLDWLRTDYRCIDDLKKARTAEWRRFGRQIFALGYDIQAAFYVRACKAAFGVEPVFRWVAIEPDPPYAMSVHVLSQKAMQSAQERVTLACEIWQDCLEHDRWPAYPLVPQTVELPAWLSGDEWDDVDLMSVDF